MAGFFGEKYAVKSGHCIISFYAHLCMLPLNCSKKQQNTLFCAACRLALSYKKVDFAFTVI
jgi:hypothetical protein